MTQLETIHRSLADLDDVRQVDTDTLQQILRFARDIPAAYGEAPLELKRSYLSFFFTHFTVQNRRIVKANPTEFFAALQRAGSVRTKPNWLPGTDSNRQPTGYTCSICYQMAWTISFPALVEIASWAFAHSQ